MYQLISVNQICLHFLCVIKYLLRAKLIESFEKLSQNEARNLSSSAKKSLESRVTGTGTVAEAEAGAGIGGGVAGPAAGAGIGSGTGISDVVVADVAAAAEAASQVVI